MITFAVCLLVLLLGGILFKAMDWLPGVLLVLLKIVGVFIVIYLILAGLFLLFG